MTFVWTVIFLLCLLGMVFFILTQKAPETAARIAAAVLGAAAAAVAWLGDLGGLFDKIGG